MPGRFRNKQRMATLDYALLNFKINFLHVTLKSASPWIVDEAAKYFLLRQASKDFATLESKRSMYINTYVYIKSAVYLNTNIYKAIRIRIIMEKRTSTYALKTAYEAQGDNVKCTD